MRVSIVANGDGLGKWVSVSSCKQALDQQPHEFGNTRGDYILFVEPFTIVHPNLFRVMVRLEKDIMFPPVNGTYDYEVDLQVIARCEASPRTAQRHNYPYRCLAAPYGTFMVRRSVWEELNPEYRDNVFIGMKAAMMGFESWMVPKVECFQYGANEVIDSGPKLETLKSMEFTKTFDEAFEQLAKLNEGKVCI